MDLRSESEKQNQERENQAKANEHARSVFFLIFFPSWILAVILPAAIFWGAILTISIFAYYLAIEKAKSKYKVESVDFLG